MCAKHVNLPNMINCNKKRDVKTQKKEIGPNLIFSESLVAAILDCF